MMKKVIEGSLDGLSYKQIFLLFVAYLSCTFFVEGKEMPHSLDGKLRQCSSSEQLYLQHCTFFYSPQVFEGNLSVHRETFLVVTLKDFWRCLMQTLFAYFVYALRCLVCHS